MKISKGLLLLLVFGTVVLLSQAAQTAKGSKKDKKGKGKRRQETDVAEVASVDPSETPAVNPTTEAQGEPHIDEEVIPSAEHNGKLGKREKKERKAAKKAAKQEKAKALRKAEKKRLRKEERKAHKHGDKAERKAAKKAARKEAKSRQQGPDAGGEIVSFDDIVQERHGGPIPNPLPPVEFAATEPDNTGAVNDQAMFNKAERRHQKKLERQQKKAEKKAKKERRRHKEHITCESDDDCGHGSCCVEKKGTHYCMKSRKDEGQKCSDDCMCRAGLVCTIEEIMPGKERGFCRVRGTPELDAGNNVGAVEDAVEDVIGVNQ